MSEHKVEDVMALVATRLVVIPLRSDDKGLAVVETTIDASEEDKSLGEGLQHVVGWS